VAAVLKNLVYRGQLLGFMMVNVAVCWLVFQGTDLLAADWPTILKNLAAAAPPSVGLIAIGALTGLIDQNWKARIVFLRWSHPLPGSRAFSHYMSKDTRIDSTRLEKKHGPFPTDPGSQNAVWYRLYKTVADRAEVSQVHRDFLINRDLAALALLSFLVVVPISYFATPAAGATKMLAIVLALEYFVFRQAATSYGARMVMTVLALKAAQGR
jgi:hypothetical protein